MNVILLPPSDKELDDAIEYYETQLTELGQRFYNEFEKTICLLNQLPYAWRKVGKHTRRINIKKFPYLILYVIEGDFILITCIAHQHRDPRYYIRRIV
ncbi:MAG: type II toxin-antitoxin system RelE/ParE family toxin [Candidatus Anammoxibacter sp.]